MNPFSLAESRPPQLKTLGPARREVCASLPNLISISWSPERGQHHMEAVTEDILRRARQLGLNKMGKLLLGSTRRAVAIKMPAQAVPPVAVLAPPDEKPTSVSVV